MYSEEEKSKFVHLRASGYSFDKISGLLDISKPTLLKWGKELELEIQNQRSLEVDQLRDQYLLTKEYKLNQLSLILKKSEEELSQRSFADLSTDKLIRLIQETHSHIERELEATFTEFEDLNSPKLTSRTVWKA